MQEITFPKSLRIGQLARLISTDTGLSLKKSSEILKVLLDTLTAASAMGDSVRIRGFGKFYLRYQKQRKIRHPLTGKSIIVEPKKIAKFQCFKSMHQEINDFDINEFNKKK